MENYQFEIIPLPKGLLAELNMLPGMALEMFSDGSRIIVQKSDSDERCCDDYGNDCSKCPYCCPGCGECRTPYRRGTWTVQGKKKIVWRCINRLDYGKKYCHHSPSIEENMLQDAIMEAIMRTAKQNADVLKTLKLHIGMELASGSAEDKSMDAQIRIAQLDAEIKNMLNAVSAENVESFDEVRLTELVNEKQSLQKQLEDYAAVRQKRESTKSRLDEIFAILDGLQNHPMEYDDRLVRQMLECVVVESKEQIKVVFAGGLEVTQRLN